MPIYESIYKTKQKNLQNQKKRWVRKDSERKAVTRSPAHENSLSIKINIVCRAGIETTVVTTVFGHYITPILGFDFRL